VEEAKEKGGVFAKIKKNRNNETLRQGFLAKKGISCWLKLKSGTGAGACG